MTELIRAIYVEDEPSVRELLVHLLRLAKVEVTKSYRSAEELLEKQDDPECIDAEIFIFDVRLPGMTGIELASKLRSEGEQRPIVAVSAWPAMDPEELERLDILFVQKPFLFGELEERIQKLLNRQG